MKKYILIFFSISIFNIYSIKAQVNGAILQGNGVTASGQYSSAIGNSNMSLGASSFSMGFTTQAKGISSFAGGWESVAEGDASFAFGYSCTAKQAYNIVFGSASQAYMPYGIAIGNNAISGTTNKGLNAICIGNQAHAEADYSMALGQFVKSSGNNSMVIGKGFSNTQFLVNNTANTIALGMGSTVPTLFVTNSGGATATGNVGIGTTLIGSKLQVNGNAAIGYSSSTAAPANGLLINGNTGIGTATVGSKLQVNGNAAIGYSSSTSAPANGLMVKGLSNFDDNIKITTTNTLTSITDVSSSPGISIKQPVQKNYSIIDFKNENETILSRIAAQEIRNQETNALQGGILSFSILNSGNTYTKLLSLNNAGIIEIGDPNANYFSIAAKSNMMLQRPNGNLHFTVDNNGNPRIYSSANKTIKFFADGQWQLTEFNNIKSNIISAYNINVGSEIIVQAFENEWKDCVFKQNYELMPLSEVEQFVKTNQHLPEIPSALEIEKNGIPLKQMNALLLQKIEELTLYIIEQQKDIQQLKGELSAIKSK